MDSFSNDSADSAALGLGGDKQGSEELQEFLYMEQQKAQLRSQIHQLTDICWNKCMDKPTAKLDGKAEACLDNCAARFVDVTLLLANRYAQVLQKAAGMQ